MVVGVEPERDLKEELLFSSRPHHAAASFRLPGPPELRVGLERSGTLAISTAVVLEGSLVHSVCIRVVAAHTKPIGGSPLPEKKIQKKRQGTTVLKLSPSGSRLSHHVCLDSDVLHELTRAGQIKPRKRASTGGHGSCERKNGFHSRESSPPRKRCWFTAFSAPLSASAFGPQLKSRALRLSPFGPAFGYHHRLSAFGPAFSLPLSGP